MFYWLIKFHYLVALNSWDIEQYVCRNSLLTKLRRHKFRNWPYLSNQSVFTTCPKSQDKNLNILRTKELLRWNKKHFSSFLKGYHWSKYKKFFLEGQSPTLSASPTKWSNTFKQFVGNSWRIAWNCLTILWC